MVRSSGLRSAAFAITATLLLLLGAACGGDDSGGGGAGGDGASDPSAEPVAGGELTVLNASEMSLCPSVPSTGRRIERSPWAAARSASRTDVANAS